MGDFTVEHIAGMIESRIINSIRFKCDHCKTILGNDTKVLRALSQSMKMRKPCQSIFEIYKADNFVESELLKGQFKLDAIKYAIHAYFVPVLDIPGLSFRH